MKIARSAQELGLTRRGVCLCIGFFDGVHLGHQQIIRQTVTDARQHDAEALVITFDPHPSKVTRPESSPPLIYSLTQRLGAIQGCGPDSALLIHFDEPFSRLTGEEFIRSLSSGLGKIRGVCVGANFVFGHRRSGDVQLLKRMGAELGFAVHGLAAVSLDGRPVSSTRIREAIKAGDLDDAGQMLGRAYSIAGQVVRGDALGRQLGFPTANIDVTGRAVPPGGVYAVRVRVGKASYRGVLNIGTRPTVRSEMTELRVEAHLLDFDGDLYGNEIEVTFVDKLRDELRFASLRELQEQIARDILEAQLRF
jgi:riboflavin kinase/FMN adenylyltransferase